MAGDWIKVEIETLGKPEVVKMAEMLGTSRYDVVGRLFHVWGWFNRQSQDGNAGSVTGTTLKRFIDELVGSQGFAASMSAVGWLHDSGIPNFDYHNSESAKKRALTSKRVKRSRNAESVTNALPEKRREEKNKNISRADAFESFWASYPNTPRKVAKAKCLQVWAAKNLDPLKDQIVSSVEALKSSKQWQDGFEPAPLTYLNQRRWEDAPAAPALPRYT